MTAANPFLTVDRALIPEERATFLAAWYRLNPGHRGAQVADILDMLHSADEHLAITEPLWERRPDADQLLALCALVAVYCYQARDAEGVEPWALALRARIQKSSETD